MPMMAAIWKERLKRSSFVFLGQVVGADPQDEEGGCGQPGGEYMWKLHPDIGVENHGCKIIHLGAPVADHIANRLLHKRVGDQDPQG